jgi:DNA-binding response OmpR family regulator
VSVARIVLADDDPSLLEVLAMAFADAGYEVTTAADGVEALVLVRAKTPPDLLVCDVNMPRLDGFALCRAIRAEGSVIPVVLLTSRDTEIDEALGLELGADDYVTKPFRARVLLARVAALLRRQVMRAQTTGTAASVLVRAGELTIDPERLEGRYRGVGLTLTLTELRLLEALARRPGIVLSRERILEVVRGDDSIVAERIVDTYVRRLRRKLEAVEPSFDRIETVIGAGYRWRA